MAGEARRSRPVAASPIPAAVKQASRRCARRRTRGRLRRPLCQLFDRAEVSCLVNLVPVSVMPAPDTTPGGLPGRPARAAPYWRSTSAKLACLPRTGSNATPVPNSATCHQAGELPRGRGDTGLLQEATSSQAVDGQVLWYGSPGMYSCHCCGVRLRRTCAHTRFWRSLKLFCQSTGSGGVRIPV
jgi:hypothetical protein